MPRRSCANCKSSEWPRFRYCEACWWAFLKASAAVLSTELAAWLIHVLLR
jgi:hypothetical protein